MQNQSKDVRYANAMLAVIAVSSVFIALCVVAQYVWEFNTLVYVFGALALATTFCSLCIHPRKNPSTQSDKE